MDASDDVGGVLAPRQLIWTELCKRLDPVEVYEVKSIVGSGIIDENEVRKLPNSVFAEADVACHRSLQMKSGF